MSKEGLQLVREHVNAPPDAGSNMARQQSLSTLSMPVQTETEEHVRGKKALKKHLQRSIGKLVAICSEHLIPVPFFSVLAY